MLEDFLYHVDYPFDIHRLVSEYDSYKAMSFSDLNPNWKRVQAFNPYAKELVDHFQQYADGRVMAGYWEQPANTEIKPHIDSVAKCRINVRLGPDDGVLHMGGWECRYITALLNVGEYEHWVTKVNHKRLIFSIIFQDDDYRKVRDKIKGVYIQYG